MKPRVLITSASKKVSLIQVFKNAGWRVTAQDINPDSPALFFADEKITIAHTDVDLVLKTRDAEFNDWYMDKEKFQEFIAEIGLEHPHTYFVKSVEGGREGKRFLYQEVIKAPEYSVDCYSDHEGELISAVPRLREKIVDGEAWITTTVEEPEIIRQAKLIVERLEFKGHCVLQCFKDKLIKWLEINPRYGASSICAIRAGLNSPYWYKSFIKKKKIAPCIGNYKRGLKLLAYRTEIFV